MPYSMSIKIDGNDQLLFRHLAWTDSLGAVPAGAVDLVSLDKAIDPHKVLRRQAKIRLQLPHDRERWFNGYVTRFTRGGAVGRYFEYSVDVRPWLWFLSRSADCRIFQKMKVDAVLRKVFDGYPLADFKLDLTGSYPELDYCVQYRETDLDFVNRMCERFGLYYYFEYTADGHQKLRIVDSMTAHEDAPAAATLPFHSATENPIDGEYVSSLHTLNQALSGKFTAQDFNFETSSLDLVADTAHPLGFEHDDAELFDYPGPFVDADGGSAEAKLRAEITDCEFETFEAVTNAQGVLPGHTLQLTQHTDPEINNAKFLVTSVSVSMLLAAYEAHGSDEGASFSCSFRALPAAVQFRPQRHTPWPLVHGTQTAIVVGPDGEEIFTDKYGRIKVLFHWDRYGKRRSAKGGGAIAPEDRSCWVRVAQIWAGNRFGAVFIPRIGHEVVIDFIDGDPDRPLVTGCVYNDKNLPPWLPENPTQSGMLTRSSKGGTAANANALRFEDKKGEEQVWLHAEKDQDIEVENDETHWVGHDRSKTIDHDETTHVKHDRTETVDNNETIAIGVNRTESVGKNETILIGVNRSEAVGAHESVTVGGNRSISVNHDESHDVRGSREVSVFRDQRHTISKNDTTDVGKDQKLEVAEHRTTSIGKDDKSQVGKKFYLDAGEEITLRTGAASIVMKKDGTIQIKGKEISIVGSGKIGIKAASDLVLKGSKITDN